MSKLLLALQYWEGDKEQAGKLARLMADLEPGRSDQADLLLVSRFDCTHDVEVIRHVSAKFNTHVYINRFRRGTGWPHGCNDLWFGTMDWLYAESECKRVPDYKAILTFEADSCPLAPNWISQLSAEWDRLQPAKVVGSLLQAPGEHINGNAMFSGDKAFLKWVARDVGGCTPHGGWDYVLAPEFKKRGWADSPFMRSFWGTKSMGAEQLKGLQVGGVSFLHGVKDDSVIRAVREAFVR